MRKIYRSSVVVLVVNLHLRKRVLLRVVVVRPVVAHDATKRVQYSHEVTVLETVIVELSTHNPSNKQ